MKKDIPTSPLIVYSLAKDTLKNGRLRLMIPIEKAVDISISVLDDENMNGMMITSLLSCQKRDSVFQTIQK